MRNTILHSLMACLLLLGACGDSTGDTNQNTSQCPEGYQPSGPACIPIFDDCPGPAEIPVLGGGCQQVGVTTCATGLFTSDGEGGCDPILPDHSCPAGTMEMLGQTECQPVGVVDCADGFESDGEGGCNAILPPDPCPSGTIALLGYTTCQPLGDCGTGTWGNIVDDSTTVYVDQTADATGADGTQQAPFVTIGEALAVVQPGGQIAVAAGDYTERLNINKEVRLTGRCAELVTVRGLVFLGDPKAPVTIAVGGTGTTIRGVTLTGPAEGLVIDGAQQVVVDQVQVRDASDIGISARGGAEVTLRQVVVAGCATAGVASDGGTLGLEESVVRDTRPQPGTGRFGRGISVECSSTAPCGSLRVSSSLVSGNRDAGIGASGVDTVVTATVVRDNLPEGSTGTDGYGIRAQCNSNTGACGSLRVSSSLVSGNQEVGIIVFGVDAEVTASVVRDTLPGQSSGLMGQGIHAQCVPELGACGSVTVTDSLVSGIRGLGIESIDVDTEITTTVVRDTQPEESTGEFGWGIHAVCSLTGACGSLRISSSLISGNRDSGIVASGMDAEITTTAVRDTLPRDSDGANGHGIHTQCSSAGACGSLRVSSSLVSGNRVAGIVVLDGDTEVTATVVRDTQPGQSNESVGSGIISACSSAQGCGRLRVSSSFISGNRVSGIFASGVDAEITTTVVRDTQPLQSDGRYGRGIQAQCDPDTEVCGSLLVSSSLVSGNLDVGIFASGVDAEITTTVVRDTLPRQSDGNFGQGVVSACSSAGACGTLLISSSLFSGNSYMGIAIDGPAAEVTATVVRGTLPLQSDGSFGRGILAHCNHEAVSCGPLRVSASLVMSSENVGISLYGVQATLEGVAVIDTRPNTQGWWRDIYGQGIWALCDPETGDCGDLTMTYCLVDSSHSGGVALKGVSGFIGSSVVRSVHAQPLDSKYGYGIQIGGLEGQGMPTFNVNDCEIRDAKLAGILYYRARGTLSGSVVSGAENSVVMNEGSEPTILDNNDLSGTVTDEPTWANLYPSPAPAPSLPVDPVDPIETE